MDANSAVGLRKDVAKRKEKHGTRKYDTDRKLEIRLDRRGVWMLRN